jgi:hypothetical protein
MNSKILFTLGFALISFPSIAQMPTCAQISISTRLSVKHVNGNKIIYDPLPIIDTRIIESAPRRIDLLLSVAHDGNMYANMPIQPFQVVVYLYFKLSIDYRCLTPINQTISQKIKLFETCIDSANIFTEGGSPIRDLNLSIDDFGERLKKYDSMSLFVTDICIETHVLTGNKICTYLHERKVCAIEPVSVVPLH